MPYKKIVCPICGINKISPLHSSCKKCWALLIYAGKIKHHSYKDAKVKYSTIHTWINRRKPKPLCCELCGEIKDTELALKGKIYTRNIHDYWYLCRKCHMITDGRLEKAIQRILKFCGEKLEDAC